MSIDCYSRKPNLTPLGKSNWNTFMGVELEVEVRDGFDKTAVAEEVKSILKDFVIAKHDSSLNYGFEICSSPASLLMHKEKWSEFFNKKKVKGIFSASTCGMHVHVSKRSLSYLQIGKMIEFIFNPNNLHFIRLIAQRRSNNYARYENISKGINDSRHGLSRGFALNTKNSDTIEFRLFNSTLKEVEFFKNLEFCAALVEFTFPSKTSIQKCNSLSCFIEFLRDNKRAYPNICLFLHQNGFKILKSKVEKNNPAALLV